MPAGATSFSPRASASRQGGQRGGGGGRAMSPPSGHGTRSPPAVAGRRTSPSGAAGGRRTSPAGAAGGRRAGPASRSGTRPRPAAIAAPVFDPTAGVPDDDGMKSDEQLRMDALTLRLQYRATEEEKQLAAEGRAIVERVKRQRTTADVHRDAVSAIQERTVRRATGSVIVYSSSAFTRAVMTAQFKRLMWHVIPAATLVDIPNGVSSIRAEAPLMAIVVDAFTDEHPAEVLDLLRSIDGATAASKVLFTKMREESGRGFQLFPRWTESQATSKPPLASSASVSSPASPVVAGGAGGRSPMQSSMKGGGFATARTLLSQAEGYAIGFDLVYERPFEHAISQEITDLFLTVSGRSRNAAYASSNYIQIRTALSDVTDRFFTKPGPDHYEKLGAELEASHKHTLATLRSIGGDDGDVDAAALRKKRLDGKIAEPGEGEDAPPKPETPDLIDTHPDFVVLQGKYEHCQQVLFGTQKELAQRNFALAELQTEHKRIEERNNELLDENEDLRKSLETSSASSQLAKERLEMMQRRAYDAARIKSLESILRNVRAKLEEHEKTLEQRDASIVDLTAEAAELKVRYQKERKALESMTQQLARQRTDEERKQADENQRRDMELRYRRREVDGLRVFCQSLQKRLQNAERDALGNCDVDANIVSNSAGVVSDYYQGRLIPNPNASAKSSSKPGSLRPSYVRAPVQPGAGAGQPRPRMSDSMDFARLDNSMAAESFAAPARGKDVWYRDMAVSPIRDLVEMQSQQAYEVLKRRAQAVAMPAGNGGRSRRPSLASSATATNTPGVRQQAEPPSARRDDRDGESDEDAYTSDGNDDDAAAINAMRESALSIDDGDAAEEAIAPRSALRHHQPEQEGDDDREGAMDESSSRPGTSSVRFRDDTDDANANADTDPTEDEFRQADEDQAAAGSTVNASTKPRRKSGSGGVRRAGGVKRDASIHFGRMRLRSKSTAFDAPFLDPHSARPVTPISERRKRQSVASPMVHRSGRTYADAAAEEDEDEDYDAFEESAMGASASDRAPSASPRARGRVPGGTASSGRAQSSSISALASPRVAASRMRDRVNKHAKHVPRRLKEEAEGGGGADAGGRSSTGPAKPAVTMTQAEAATDSAEVLVYAELDRVRDSARKELAADSEATAAVLKHMRDIVFLRVKPFTKRYLHALQIREGQLSDHMDAMLYDLPGEVELLRKRADDYYRVFSERRALRSSIEELQKATSAIGLKEKEAIQRKLRKARQRVADMAETFIGQGDFMSYSEMRLEVLDLENHLGRWLSVEERDKMLKLEPLDGDVELEPEVATKARGLMKRSSSPNTRRILQFIERAEEATIPSADGRDRVPEYLKDIVDETAHRLDDELLAAVRKSAAALADRIYSNQTTIRASADGAPLIPAPKALDAAYMLTPEEVAEEEAKERGLSAEDAAAHIDKAKRRSEATLPTANLVRVAKSRCKAAFETMKTTTVTFIQETQRKEEATKRDLERRGMDLRLFNTEVDMAFLKELTLSPDGYRDVVPATIAELFTVHHRQLKRLLRHLRDRAPLTNLKNVDSALIERQMRIEFNKETGEAKATPQQLNVPFALAADTAIVARFADYYQEETEGQYRISKSKYKRTCDTLSRDEEAQTDAIRISASAGGDGLGGASEFGFGSGAASPSANLPAPPSTVNAPSGRVGDATAYNMVFSSRNNVVGRGKVNVSTFGNSDASASAQTTVALPAVATVVHPGRKFALGGKVHETPRKANTGTASSAAAEKSNQVASDIRRAVSRVATAESRAGIHGRAGMEEGATAEHHADSQRQKSNLLGNQTPGAGEGDDPFGFSLGERATKQLLSSVGPAASTREVSTRQSHDDQRLRDKALRAPKPVSSARGATRTTKVQHNGPRAPSTARPVTTPSLPRLK